MILVIAIDIRDLNEVIALLERHDYSKALYNQLGLCFKVSKNTLETIKKNYREGDPCFTEFLASWLCKAEESNNIDTLIAALRGIGENAVVHITQKFD